MLFMASQSRNHSSKRILILQLLVLAMATIMLYGNFLSSQLVFDDVYYFRIRYPEFLKFSVNLDLRWLPYATFEWTRVLAGNGVFWLRIGNLALHIANIFLLFLLLRSLFAAALVRESAPPTVRVLSSSWLAFFGALIFALHPVTVYGAAYLIQRTILMATLFALMTYLLFSEGLLRNKRSYLLASAVTYLLAVLSKEHAIMVPAVCAALLFLLRKPDRHLLVRVWPTFLLYGLVAAFIIYQVKNKNILGYAYEPNGVALLSRVGINPADAYPLSILTQSFLYFKYVWLWLLPNPAWMSADMPEDFAAFLWTWPHTAGLVGFIGYFFIATYLLLQRGKKGLLGFAMLFPWLLFATELSTVRIQEIFVLYRSYLWMPGLFAALPFVFQKLSIKYSVAILIAITLAIIPATWDRLTVFSNPVLLWGDALRYAQKNSYWDIRRMYIGRGAAYLDQELYPQAIEDLSKAIQLAPRN
ncbi:MAG: glycosyltransferase family 39 protein, partial [Gallionellaceae bacterium]|nr:glycosyltransferase family 39 protein [Gallionellaceae bacterium]